MATTKKRATAARGKAMVVDDGARGGFTIIEVVLVLAIAGLIFLMVFLAYPALRRSQHDSQRQRDMGTLSAQISKYQNNNSGRLPSDSDKVVAREDGDEQDLDATWPCSASSTAVNNSANCFIRNYMNSATADRNEWIDPSGYSYGLQFLTLASGGEAMLGNADYIEHVVYVYKHARCEGEKAIYSSNSRDFAILYKLEGAGTYCGD